MSEQRTNLTVASSVKEYALACSKAHRAGKFKRVSQEFLDDIEAEVDKSGTITRLGVTCALCHSTVDDSVLPGVGLRVDGQPVDPLQWLKRQ
jgi:hypothetical protein